MGDKTFQPQLQSYRQRRIVVTGSTGYLATNLIHALKGIDCHIVRVSRPGTRFDPIDGRACIEAITGDLCDPLLWQRVLAGTDYVFHLAAQTSAYSANSNPPADFEMNVAPMLALLETCRRNGWRPTVLFASTATISGIPDRLPVDESHSENPLTIYCLHKLLAEKYLNYYSQEGIVAGLSLRLANVYGPGPQSSSSQRGILNQMIRKAIQRESLTIYGDGCYIRDYIYIDDVVSAFLQAGACIDTLQQHGRHYVIGSGHGYFIKDALNLVAERVTRRTGKLVPISHVPPPAGLSPIECRNFIADTTRFSQATGWQASTRLIQGIDCTIENIQALS